MASGTRTLRPTDSTKPRGGVVHTLCLAEELHRQGYPVHVVTLGDPEVGFFRPVDMNGVVNSVKAGSAVPIKFSLDGDQGLDILAAGSPTITFTACNAGASVDPLEETVTAGGSSLSYDPVADQYVYVWKTVKTWAGKCGTFTLKLDDGTAHSALFAFTK